MKIIKIGEEYSKKISTLSFICTILIVIYHSSMLPVIGNIAMSWFWCVFNAVKIKDFRILDSVLPSSFFIYALHAFLLVFIRKVLCYYGYDYLTGFYVFNIFIIPIICVFFSHIARIFLQKLSPKLIDILTGGR